MYMRLLACKQRGILYVPHTTLPIFGWLGRAQLRAAFLAALVSHALASVHVSGGWRHARETACGPGNG